jgi:hypothetical protein
LHELTYIWINYFWSSDKGNGPEALTEMLVVGVIASFIVPRVRAWWIKEAKKADAELHRKLDHIITHHPDIPPLPPSAQDGGRVGT